MKFEELFDALRALSEENNANGYRGGRAPFDPFAGDSWANQSGPSALQTWTLQPDHIDVLVQGLSTLHRQNLLLIAVLDSQSVPGNKLEDRLKWLVEKYTQLIYQRSNLSKENEDLRKEVDRLRRRLINQGKQK